MQNGLRVEAVGAVVEVSARIRIFTPARSKFRKNIRCDQVIPIEYIEQYTKVGGE